MAEAERSGSRRLRILLVAHGFPPESVGGVEQHVDGLATALVARGHAPHVVVRTAVGEDGEFRDDDPGRRPFPVTRLTYRFHDVAALGDLHHSEFLSRAWKRFLTERPRFDVAHVHHLTGIGVDLLTTLRQAGIATVLSLHDYWPMCPRGQMWHRRGEVCERVEPERCADCLATPFGHLLGDDPVGRTAAHHASARAALAAADVLVVPSARALPAYVALGVDAGRFQVVENGVDTDRLATVAPPRRAVGEPLVVGYLGTLIPSKGLDVLVAAVQRLPPGAARLEVFGNAVPYHGDDGFLTRALGRLRPEDPVTLHGPYATTDLAAILRQVHCLAVPALWQETFGLTVREAMAAGRPVVASAVGGLQDAIDDGVDGLLVPPGDVAALAAALGRLAGEPELLPRLAGRCRGRARSLAAMAAELAELYQARASVRDLDHGAGAS